MAADLLLLRNASQKSGYSASSRDPPSPHTPTLSRALSSQYESPSLYRVEDDPLILECGARILRLGIAGESTSRVAYRVRPEDRQKYTLFSGQNPVVNHNLDWELWNYDIPNLDLEIVANTFQRVLRRILDQHVMLDIKMRSMLIIFPPGLPNPLIELALTGVFGALNSPKSVSLMSSAACCTIAAGLRSALVIDIGWHEVTITAVYEYRQVYQKKSNRAGRRLHYTTSRFFSGKVAKNDQISFKQIEGIIVRDVYCKVLQHASDQIEQTYSTSTKSINIGTKGHLQIPFNDLSIPVEDNFFNFSSNSRVDDNHDVPLPTLIWKILCTLPIDVRSVCVSRLVITGGCSNIPGLSTRIMQEVQQFIDRNGWDLVYYGSCFSPKALNKQETNIANTSNITRSSSERKQPEIAFQKENSNLSKHAHSVSTTVKVVKTMGAWAGASLLASLKSGSTLEITKENFIKHGINILENNSL